MLLASGFLLCAEGVGFEPTVRCRTPVFKTGAFDLSAIPPVGGSRTIAKQYRNTIVFSGYTTSTVKYLAIDYGTKYVGLAMSDVGGHLAFPYKVIPHLQAKGEIEQVIEDEDIEAIVVGYSLQQSGAPNALVAQAKRFMSQLGVRLPIYWEDERFSSLEASRHRYDNRPIANPRRKGKVMGRDDASAAAIILQRFLDKQD